jgi:hypothetical protein
MRRYQRIRRPFSTVGASAGFDEGHRSCRVQMSVIYI